MSDRRTMDKRLEALEARVDQLEWRMNGPKKLGAVSMIESFDPQGRRVIDPDKVDKVRLIKRLYASKQFSYARLADRLNESGEASSGGRTWHARTVRRAVKMDLPVDILPALKGGDSGVGPGG